MFSFGIKYLNKLQDIDSLKNKERFTIKDLENFTGIKAHTIRIWEKRYKLLEPKRTETNIRFYDENDLKKILNINLLYNNSYKISKIALLREQEIFEASKSLILNTSNSTSEVDQLTLAILKFEKEKVLDIFSRYSKNIFELYEKIIVPFLIKVGELWQVNSIQIIHEHFFSILFKEYLHEKITSLDATDKTNSNVLLFLHEKEEHEFTILLYYYLFKSKGYNCFYMGQSVPISDLEFAIPKIKPKYIFTSCIAKLEEKEFITIIDTLLTHATDSKIIMSGYQTSMYENLVPKSITLINSKEGFEELAQNI